MSGRPSGRGWRGSPLETVRLLQAASVVGREFPSTVVADMLEAPELTCLPLVEEAAAAGLVAARPPGHHRFVHDLVRDAVEAGLAAAERVRLHRSAADAVERLHAGRLEPHLSDLARHWAAAAVSGERERAATGSRVPRTRRCVASAYEEAARLYRLALTAGAGDIDDDRRCRLLLGVAGALKAAGELSGRLPACREAAALARVLRPPGPARRGGAGHGGRRVETSRPRRRCERRARRRSLRCLRRRRALRARVAANLSDGVHVPRRPRGGRPCERARAGDGRPLRRPRLRSPRRCGPVSWWRPGRRGWRSGRRSPTGCTPSVARAGIRRCGCGGTCGGSTWRSSAATSPPSAGSWNRSRTARPSCAPRWRAGTCCRRGRSSRRPWAGSPTHGCWPTVRWPRSRRPRPAGSRRRSTGRRCCPWSALHTGEASDLTGLLDYGPGHEDGDGLDFPIEGVIFSIAAAFFLAHGGRLAQAATVYRRLGPPASWRPTPHATTSCFALGIGTAIALDASDDVAVLRGRLARFRGRHVADGAGAVAYNGPVELYLGAAAAHLGLSTRPSPTSRRRRGPARRTGRPVSTSSPGASWPPS